MDHIQFKIENSIPFERMFSIFDHRKRKTVVSPMKINQNKSIMGNDIVTCYNTNQKLPNLPARTTAIHIQLQESENSSFQLTEHINGNTMRTQDRDIMWTKRWSNITMYSIDAL